MSHCIKEDYRVVKLFATNAESHVDKELEDWRTTTILAETVVKLSDLVIDVAKRRK